jgi:hypothetical protein
VNPVRNKHDALVRIPLANLLDTDVDVVWEHLPEMNQYKGARHD